MGVGALPVAALGAFPELQPTSRLAVIAACGIPYLSVPLAGSCGAMVVASRSRGAKVLWSVALAAVVAEVSRRWFAPGTPGPTSTADDLTVLSANVLNGRGDVQQVAALARGSDLIAIQECTPAFAEALSALLATEFPHTVGSSRDGADGTMVWSRTPLELMATGHTGFTSVVGVTTVRGITWTIANVHPLPPQRGSRRWEDDAQQVLDLVTPHLRENLVVVGDFNAIEEHLTMRRLAATGLRNAMSGWRSPGVLAWQPSWPTDKAFVPPVIRIDHALHSESVEAWRPRYIVVTGSDHKALLATFRAR